MQPYRENLEKKFTEVYERLNPQQQFAVDTIEGPVMVIAGPGTGKTQILAARIAKILLDTDAQAQNILCLTYTDAGVVAMRKRLLSFIGSDAYKVNIHTFHSFCNMVIQENIRYFDKKNLEALSDLERVEFLKQLIDGFDKDNPLKRYKGEIYYDLPNLSGLFSAIKREGWTEEKLLQQVDEYINDILPNTDGLYNKREKAKGILVLTQKGKDEVERMEKLKAAVQAFKNYQQILHANHRYDFDDMINWVIDIFQKHEEVLLNYQEQFQYILVDEYQDTSGSQNRIIELLISYWQDQPNVFVVGDDDQSIYRFQGANLQNMTNLLETYKKDIAKVVLTQNYRSVQPILDAAKGLIENNKERLVEKDKDLNKELISSRPSLRSLNILPEVFIYENEFSENVHVTNSIKKLIQDGISPGRIAVIYKEHKFGDELMKFFQLSSIPFYVRKSINLLNDVFIKQVLNIARYTVAELETAYSGEPLLFEILHYEFFKNTASKIAKISNELSSARGKTMAEASFRNYLSNLKKSNNATLFSSDADTDELIRIHDVLEALQEKVFNSSTQHWFEFMINEAGILAYVMNHPERSWLMAKLSCLFDYVKESTHRKPELTLKQLVEQIDLLHENGLSLPLIQTTGTEAGVNLLTGHGSKGLEYEYVFLMGARNDIWEGKRKVNRGFKVPHNVLEQESAAETTEELRRLFFVAVTRAEKHLFISYPLTKNDGKLLEPSQFVEEIRLSLNLEPKMLALNDEDKILFGALRFGIVQKPELEKLEADYINRLLEKFVMNVTALNNYLDCPLKFYYSSLVRVPMAKSEAAEFGTAVHGALADFINKMMANDKIYPSQEYLIEQFRFHINSSREVFTRESFQRFMEHGENVLAKYFDKYYNPAPLDEFVITEYPLTKVVLNDIPLKGFTDKIQFWNNEVVITDFKTGSLPKSKLRGEFDLPGSEKKPQGGNYWRQAVFYKILVDNLPGKNWKIQYIQFDFVEPNAKGDFDLQRVDISAEDIDSVKTQINETWNKIQGHDFYTGCGKPECEWCNFVKENKLQVALHEMEEPEA